MSETHESAAYLARMLELDQSDGPVDPCLHPTEAVVAASDGWHWCTACDVEAWVGPEDAANHPTNPPDDSAPVRDVRADEGASA